MKKIIVAIIILLLPALRPMAQPKGIVLIGKVVSLEGHAALEGVVVEVKGTKNVSGTLYDGMYAIEIQPGDSVLVFSYEGYETREIKISKDKREYDVLLKSKP